MAVVNNKKRRVENQHAAFYLDYELKAANSI